MTHASPLLGTAARSAADIAAELRRDFARLLEARYGTAALPDPVLATMFHAFATRIGAVYDEAEHLFPEAVLDDLVAGLDMPPRRALPAQAVVSFAYVTERERITEDTELSGYLKTGARMCFRPDVPIEIAPTELVFAAAYERGRLHALPGARLPDGAELPPGSVPLALGDAAPAIYLAFRTDAAHLSALGMYVDAGPADGPVVAALGRASWQMLGPTGRVVPTGALRPVRGRGGVHRLEWVDSPPASHESDTRISDASPLDEGMYGRTVWVFPRVPAERRHWSPPPSPIAAALAQLLPPEHVHTLTGAAAWVQIALPAGAVGVANAIQHIAVNCVTVSNVERMAERVTFDRMGMVVTLSPEEDHERHLLGVSSVVGETGSRYVEQSVLDAPRTAGRFHHRRKMLHVCPAQHATGRFDSYAMAHLVYCDGTRANGIAVGDLCAANSRLANLTASVRNLTVSRGGCAPPPYAAARTRFAEALRTRERMVTAADIDVAARAFEPRIEAVELNVSCERTPGGLRPVDRVTVRVRRDDFTDPEAEVVRLRDRLEQHLQDRAMIGRRIRVSVERALA